MRNTFRARHRSGSLTQRLGIGAACTATVGLGLLGLLPHTASAGGASGVNAGSVLPTPSLGTVGAPATANANATAAPAPSTLCPTPKVLGVSAETVTGYSAPTGSQSGPSNTLVAITGDQPSGPGSGDLEATGCMTTITIDGVTQPAPTPTAANPTPPSDTSNVLYFVATGQSGPVTVTLSDVSGNANSSNDNFTFLSPPKLSGFSPTSVDEGSGITANGSGFSLGGIVRNVYTTWYTGAAPTPSKPTASLCSASPVQLSSSNADAQLTAFAPATYCAGHGVLTFDAPDDTTQPMQGKNINSVTVTTPTINVVGTIAYYQPTQPIAGQALTIYGSGFGSPGHLVLHGRPVNASAYNDRYIRLTVPANATSGELQIVRSDGTGISVGAVTVLPVGSKPPAPTVSTTNVAGPFVFAPNRPGYNLSIAPTAASLKAASAATPVRSAPVYGGLTGTSALTALYPTQEQEQPNFVNLQVFAWLAGALLIAAIVFGALNAARVLAAAQRLRRGAERRLGPAADSGDRPTRRRSALRPASRASGMRIGHLLLRDGAIDRHQLGEALATQRADGRPLGEILVSMGALSERGLWRNLGVQWGASLGDLTNHWIDIVLARRIDSAQSIRHRLLPLRATRDSAIVAMADPFDRAAVSYVERRLAMRIIPVLAAPSAIRAAQIRVYGDEILDTSIDALHTAMPEASARVVITKDQKVAAGLAALSLVVLAFVFGGPFFIACAAAVISLYALVVGFRTWVIVRGAKYDGVVHVSESEMSELTDLPIYTILCPLYKEAGVLPQLVKACSDLDYPSHLLDVKLLLEADDVETIEVVNNSALPPYFDAIVVPAVGPRTKPKACNYGLQFARGEYVVIFDAEDIPEPDQLKKALATFRRSASDVGCVQARLNFYNPKQNILTGWFTLEYSSWFDFFLPGLVSLGMPVPLGGSSNHFPTKLLLELNAWDPENVTEDADLGMRLHRAGYRTLIVDSTTYEEANSDFVNWIKQRSRWGKGYAISWIVQMRHPRTLYRQLGFKSFLSLQLTLGGTFGVALLNLGVWFLTLLWILAQFAFIQYLFPTYIYYIGMVELLLGNAFFVYIGLWSAQHRKNWYLNRVALAAPLYWLMMSIAMVKATLQIITKPTYWEKTVHGLFTTPSHATLEPALELVGSGADRDRVAAEASSEAVAPHGDDT